MDKRLNTARVTFQPINVAVTAQAGDTLLDVALDNGIGLEHECGGNCSCTTCHVHIVEGADNLSPIEWPEDERLDTADYRKPNSRLACQALLGGGNVVVFIVSGQAESQDSTQ